MATGPQLRVGAGAADITPAMGIQIAGDIGRYRPVEEIRDPLFAKALVLEAGGKRVCWLSLDVLAISRKWADTIRTQASARYGLDPATVMVHVVQNHAAPSVGHFFTFDEDDWGQFPREYPWLLGGDDRYNPVCLEGVLQAIGKALDALQPATVKVGRGVDGRVAFNRRFVMRDGKVKTHPPDCSPDILHTEGPVDPEVGVALLLDQADQPVTALLHFTCHPVHGYPQRWISPDWPGAWVEGVRGLLGGKAIPMVINGACGNVHHHNHLNPRNHETDTIEIMGARLTETTATVLDRLQPLGADTLAWSSRIVNMPWRKTPEAQIAAARDLIARQPKPVPDKNGAIGWDWVFAVALMDIEAQKAKQPAYDLELQVLRIGDLCIACWPGEPFVEGQLEVKRTSPAPYTFVAHWCNDAVSYVPTTRGHEGGGFEVTLPWCRLAPGALETMASETRQMLESLCERQA